MAAAAASNLKPVSLELGGKSPMLIFDDADVNEAVNIAFNGLFFNKVRYLLLLRQGHLCNLQFGSPIFTRTDSFLSSDPVGRNLRG